MAISSQEIIQLSNNYDLDPNIVNAIMLVESSGKGFDPKTGKIMIQFEPHWFKKLAKNPPEGQIWRNNKVEPQSGEWKAFNDAFRINPTAAMLSTSIGLMQVMGFNHEICGFADVGSMWDFAKESEINQLELGLRFIIKQIGVKPVRDRDWDKIARIYNGPAYKKYSYDAKMKRAFEHNKIV